MNRQAESAYIRKCMAVMLFVLSVLLCAEAIGDEFSKNTLYVTLREPDEIADTIPSDAVGMQTAGGKQYLFLPGNQSLEHARVWFTGAEEIIIEDETYHSGDLWRDVMPGTKYSFKINGRTNWVTVMQGSRIPSVQILTDSRSMKKIDDSKKYKESGELLLLNENGETEYDGRLEHIKLRGNTSAKYRRKGYQIKLETKTGLLGMGKAKKWVLTSNNTDHSLLRNQITLAMADYVGLPYTPGCVQADVYLNHQYNGTYVLQEKIEIGKNRVDISDLEKATGEVNTEPLGSYKNRGKKQATSGEFKYMDIPNNPEDVTGGYLLEYENWPARYTDELCAYTTKRKKVISVKEPEYASLAQMEYISSFIQGFEDAIFSEDGVDPASGKHFYEFVDLDSLALKYMLEEISRNIDGNQSSQYYYKPPDSVSTVAFAGPAWDYDCSYGDYAGKESMRNYLKPRGFSHNDRNGSRYWWPEMYKLPEFRERVSVLWNERYMDAIAVLLGEKPGTGRIRSIDEYAAEISKSADMTFTAFPMTTSKSNLARTGDNFEENIDFLRNYLSDRRDFLNEEWADLK